MLLSYKAAYDVPDIRKILYHRDDGHLSSALRALAKGFAFRVANRKAIRAGSTS
jgi:hypothetical protein